MEGEKRKTEKRKEAAPTACRAIPVPPSCPPPIRSSTDRRRTRAAARRGSRRPPSWVYSCTPMRLPLRSFGSLILLLLAQIKLCRNARDAKTGMATKDRSPATWRVIYSEADSSQASNSRLAIMRSKMLDVDEVDIESGGLDLAHGEGHHAVVEGGGEIAGDGRHGNRSVHGVRFLGPEYMVRVVKGFST
ncbi:hypothetical protein VTN96DRAFT_6210 [Rasamsonia emersonii]